MHNCSDVTNSVFMDYASQLKSQEWKEKRMKILARDNHRCRMCGKGISIYVKFDDKYYNLGIDYSLPDITPDDIIATKISIDGFKSLVHSKSIMIREINQGRETLLGVSDNGILGIADSNIYSMLKSGIGSNDLEVNMVRHKSGMLCFLINLKNQDLSEIKVKVPYLSETPVSLNVHHKHYIIQHKAWEYDDDDLITLCKECHTKVHHAIGAPVYSQKNGFMKEIHLTPCLRCGGTGYFPEYKHIEDGVCFRCRGARFEELIENNV